MQTYRNGSATTHVRKTSRSAIALASLGLLILYGACRGGEGGYSGGGGGAGDCLEADCRTPPSSTCGNGAVEGDELCDKTDLNKETCKTLGDGLYTGGTLRCSSRCTFDVSMCFGPTEICDDNVDNDADGKADCDDPDCSGDANCSENGAGGQPGSGGATQGTAGAGPSEAGGAGGDGGASQGMAGSGGAGGESSGSTDKLIYLIDMPKKSNFGGITGADALCAQSAPPSANVKALIVNGTTRYACTTANCDGGVGEHLDWVLSPDTAYARPDGTRIGVTNSAGVFVFPLDAAIAPGYTYWTGLTGTWTSNDDDCADWSQTTGYFAYLGNGDVTTSDAISGVTESCAYLAGAFIACVEQ